VSVRTDAATPSNGRCIENEHDYEIDLEARSKTREQSYSDYVLSVRFSM